MRVLISSLLAFLVLATAATAEQLLPRMQSARAVLSA